MRIVRLIDFWRNRSLAKQNDWYESKKSKVLILQAQMARLAHAVAAVSTFQWNEGVTSIAFTPDTSMTAHRDTTVLWTMYCPLHYSTRSSAGYGDRRTLSDSGGARLRRSFNALKNIFRDDFQRQDSEYESVHRITCWSRRFLHDQMMKRSRFLKEGSTTLS